MAVPLRRYLPAAWLAATLFAFLVLLLGDTAIGAGGVRLPLPRAAVAGLWGLATVALAFFLVRERLSVHGFLEGGWRWLPLAPVAVLPLLLATDLRMHIWFFYFDRRAAGTLLLLIPAGALLLGWSARRGWDRWLLPLLLAAAQIYLIATLFQTTGGEPLYRDDHPSFMYRFWLTVQAFPWASFWNPFWNGGYLGYELVSSGARALGLLAAPFVFLFGVERIYTPFLTVVFVGVLPWIGWWAARIHGLSIFAAWMAAMLVLGTHHSFFIHLLVFGTSPSLLVAFLAVVVWIILKGAVEEGRATPGRWLALVVALQFIVLYPGVVMVLAAIGSPLLFAWPKVNRRLLLFLGGAAILLLLVNGPTILEYAARPAFRQFMAHRPDAAVVFSLEKGLHSLGSLLKQTNPLILVAGFLALLLPMRWRDRAWLYTPLVCLGAMIVAGPQMRSHLQMERMVIPFTFFLAMAGAWGVGRLDDARRLPGLLMRGAVAGALLLTVLGVGKIYRNQGREFFRVMAPEVKELATFLRADVPPEGRVFFAGPSIHGYGGGHVSYLQAATGRGMISGDYYHFDRRLVDYDPVPRAFRGNARLLYRYLRLMGVTHVVTYIQDWKDRLARQTRCYELVGTFGKRSVFRTKVRPGLLRGARGRVEQEIDRVTVHLEEPAEKVVLRLNWLPGLAADPPVALAPVEVAPGLTFIGITPGEARRIVLRVER